MAATAARMAVAGDSVAFSSVVSAPCESQLVSAGSGSVFVGSVSGEGSDGLFSAPSVQLAGSGSVGLVSGSSVSLFVAGSDAGSADLGFVDSALVSVSAGLGSELSGLAATVSAPVLGSSGKGLGSDAISLVFPVSGSVSVDGASVKGSVPGLISAAPALVSAALSSVSAALSSVSVDEVSVSGSVSGLVSSAPIPVSAVKISAAQNSDLLGLGLESVAREKVAGSELSASVSGSTGKVAGSVPEKVAGSATGKVLVSAASAALSSVPADGVPVSVAGSVQSLSSASVSASAPVSALAPQVSVGEIAVSGLVSELSSISAAVGLGLEAASGLIFEKSSGSAAVGLGVSVAELNGSDLMLRDTEVVSEQSLAHGKGVEIPKKSYLSAVQQKSSLSKHNLSVVSEDGVQVVQVPDDILTNVQHLWDDLIIGKFPDDSPHIAKVHVIVNKIWAYGNKLSRVDAFVVNKSTIKFRIKDPVIRDRVLRRGMWNIADKPMIVSKYGPIDEEDSTPRSMSLWVTLTQIPPSYYSWKGLSFLSSVVGEPKRLHPETELCNKFDEAKVFIEVDLTKPLPDSFSFKSRNGVVSEVKYSYPWLPPRCCACGKWGHLIDVCRTVTILKRNTQVLDPPHPVGIATDAGGGVATPLSVTVTKSGNTHPTKDLTAVSAVTKTISDTGNQPPAGFPPPPTNQLSPALSHPVCQASDVGGSGGTPLSVTREIQGENMDKEGWSLVSPKKSHHGQKVTPEVLKLGSPSRYSVLVGQDELDTPAIFDKPSAVVPREVHTENKIIVATGHQQLGGKKNETIIRPSLPRQSKTARKNNSTASNLSRKGEVTKKNSN